VATRLSGEYNSSCLRQNDSHRVNGKERKSAHSDIARFVFLEKLTIVFIKRKPFYVVAIELYQTINSRIRTLIRALRIQEGNRFVEALRYILVLMVVLSFAGYYLLPSSQANNFPTYGAAIFFILDVCLSRTQHVQRSSAFRCFIVFLLYLLISVSWSQSLVANEMYSLIGSAALLVVMILSIERCMRYFQWFGTCLLSAMVCCAAASSLFYLFLVFAGGGDPPGRLSTHSVAAISYGSALVVAAFLMLRARAFVWRLLWSLCFAVLGFASLILETSYVWLALAGSVSVIAFSRVWENRDTTYVFGWMVVATCLLGAFLYLFDMVLVSNRQVIWESVVNSAYVNNLVIGSGILAHITPMVDCNEFPRILDSFSSCSFKHSHNLFVSSLFRGGIIGLALLVVLFLVSISSALLSEKGEKWLVFAMLSYSAIIFLFDGDQLVSKLDFVWMIFWLPVALSISLEARELDEDR
jgi:hypothetical protein